MKSKVLGSTVLAGTLAEVSALTSLFLLSPIGGGRPHGCHKPRNRIPAWWCSRPRKATQDSLALFKSSDENTAGEGTVGSSVGKTLEFQVHSSISSIPAKEWDACLAEHSSPFLSHSWLRCLEESKSACPSTGWVPQHVSIHIDSRTVGYVPFYIKEHSMGEFIFDQQFAEVAYQNSIEYYPKLLVGVPFTPVSGRRILWHPELVLSFYNSREVAELNRGVGNFLKQIAVSNKLSSVHLNFLTDEEATDLSGPLEGPEKLEAGRGGGGIKRKVENFFRNKLEVKDDYLRRTSIQYHWYNRDPTNNGRPYESFDNFIGCFKSKKRINIRRERRRVRQEEKVLIDIIVGKDILKYTGLVKRMFDIYLSTIDKMVWGRQYLTLEFFEMLSKSDFIDNLLFICCRKGVATSKNFKAEDVFAGTFSK